MEEVFQNMISKCGKIQTPDSNQGFVLWRKKVENFTLPIRCKRDPVEKLYFHSFFYDFFFLAKLKGFWNIYN